MLDNSKIDDQIHTEHEKKSDEEPNNQDKETKKSSETTELA